MSNFRKGHQYSNELAEITLVGTRVNLAGGGSSTFPQKPCVAGRNFRLVEAGFTAVTTVTIGAGPGTIVTIDDNNIGAQDYVVNQLIPALTAPDVTTGIGGASVSTSRGGAAAWAFDPAGLDTDGVAQVITGQELSYTVSAGTGTGVGYVWVRLAPEINRDVDV